ncbi:hypothetical protein CLAUR_043730 [Clostridium felsineum]|nr:hypothetical protein CLAUR_043730 [Clostridium felsineum]
MKKTRNILIIQVILGIFKSEIGAEYKMKNKEASWKRLKISTSYKNNIIFYIIKTTFIFIKFLIK